MKRPPRGSAYVLVLFVLLVLNIMFLSLVNESRRDKPGAHQYLHDTQAFYLAQSGLITAVRDLQTNFDLSKSTKSMTTEKLLGGTVTSDKTPLELGYYSYTIDVVPIDTTMTRYVIKARGEVPLGRTRPLAKRVIVAVYEQGEKLPLHMVYWKSPHYRLAAAQQNNR